MAKSYRSDWSCTFPPKIRAGSPAYVRLSSPPYIRGTLRMHTFGDNQKWAKRREAL